MTNRNEAGTGSQNVIVEMTMSDYDSVFALLRETPGVVLRDADSRDAIASYLKRNPGLSFVARNGDRLVGCLLSGHDGRRGYLHHLAVDPSCRRCGIGSALVRLCLERLQRQGIRKSHVDVLIGNETAHLFWSRRGWERRNELVKYSFVSSADQSA